MSKVLFQYREDTTTETLLRHHRIARWIIYPCGFFSLLMFSSTAEGLLVGFDPIMIIVVTVSVCVAALLVVPACFCVPWIRDIEDELAKRGAAISRGQDINGRIVGTACKMMAWATVIVAGPIGIRKLVQLIAQLNGRG